MDIIFLALKNKKFYIIISICIFCILGSIYFAQYRIHTLSETVLFSEVLDIPYNKVGLVLGTSKNTYGMPNGYFWNRIEATSELFSAGKISYIVVSGDHGTGEYNEPQDMKDALIKKGIPKDRIYLDYAGFRTYDSIIRMQKIFGQNKFTVISQEFHNERAVYIAKAFNLDVVGFNAPDVPARSRLKTDVRELFARVKVFIDLFLNMQPRYLGEKILIP